MSDLSKRYQIARRYADAVFGLLNEKEKKTFCEEGNELVLANHESPVVGQFLKNPLYDAAMKAEFLLTIFPKSVKTENLKSFFYLLCQKKRETLLPIICELFEEKYYASQGAAICNLSVAQKPGTAVLNSIQEKLNDQFNKKLILKLKIDPTLIGGFRAEVNGSVFDVSVKNQLTHMKTSIVSGLKNI